MFTQPQAGTPFDGGSRIGLGLKRSENFVRALESTGRVGAHANNPFLNRFVVEQAIKLDHTMHICQWHGQGPGYFTGYLLRQPTVVFLSGMQSGQQPGATKGNVWIQNLWKGG
jgi:hypothetical protein